MSSFDDEIRQRVEALRNERRQEEIELTTRRKALETFHTELTTFFSSSQFSFELFGEDEQGQWHWAQEIRVVLRSSGEEIGTLFLFDDEYVFHPGSRIGLFKELKSEEPTEFSKALREMLAAGIAEMIAAQDKIK